MTSDLKDVFSRLEHIARRESGRSVGTRFAFSAEQKRAGIQTYALWLVYGDPEKAVDRVGQLAVCYFDIDPSLPLGLQFDMQLAMSMLTFAVSRMGPEVRFYATAPIIAMLRQQGIDVSEFRGIPIVEIPS